LCFAFNRIADKLIFPEADIPVALLDNDLLCWRMTTSFQLLFL
jgi:hypothetical protein